MSAFQRLPATTVHVGQMQICTFSLYVFFLVMLMHCSTASSGPALLSPVANEAHSITTCLPFAAIFKEVDLWMPHCLVQQFPSQHLCKLLLACCAACHSMHRLLMHSWRTLFSHLSLRLPCTFSRRSTWPHWRCTTQCCILLHHTHIHCIMVFNFAFIVLYSVWSHHWLIKVVMTSLKSPNSCVWSWVLFRHQQV